MPLIIGTILVMVILGCTHYAAYNAGRNTNMNITKERLREQIVVELKNDKKNHSKG